MTGVRGSTSMLVAVVSTGMIGAGAFLAGVPVAHAATTVAPKLVGARAGATRVPFSLGGGVSASVDVGTGNLLVNTTDARVPGAKGQVVGFGLSYNSLDAAGGWSSPLGAHLNQNSDGSYLLVDTDGRQGTFSPVTGSSTMFTAPAGFKKTLVKNSDGSFTLMDLPSNSTETFTSSGVLSKIADRDQTTETITATSVTLAGGNSVAVAGNAQSKITGFTPTNHVGPTAGTVTYAYGSGTNRLSQITVTNVAGGSAVTKFTYTSAGDLATVTDAVGTVTTMTYDSYHRVTAVAQGTGASTATTRFEYFSTYTDVADPTSDQSKLPYAVPHTLYGLTSDQLVASAKDPLGRNRSATYTSQSDVLTSTSATGAQGANVYGANSGNSVTKSTSGTGATQTATYGNTGASAYEPSGGTDGQGNSSLSTYSNTGDAESATDGGGAKASVTYNSDGTVATSTDPAGHVTHYTEASTGQYTTTITPPTGSGLGATTFTGDPSTSVTNGAGQATSYTYDGLYNVTKASSSDGSVTYTYDADGRVVSQTGKNQHIAYTYDTRGDLTQIATTPVAGGKAPAAATVSYTYDLAGVMTSRTVDGSTTTYVYDADHELTSMTEPTGAVTAYAYNKDGQRTDTWWHTNAAHTTWVAHTNNTFGTGGDLAQTFTSVNSSDATSNRMSDYSYCYAKYKAGTACPTGSSSANTGLVQYLTNNKAGYSITLGYDKSNRLTSATGWAGHNYVYTYDADGNRTKTTVDGTTTQTLTFNTDNEISSTGYSYDKAGRRTSDPTAGSTTWNSLGQAVTQKNGSASGGTSYAGTGQDQLLTQSNGSTTDSYVYGHSSQAGIPTEEEVTATGSSTPTLINNDANGEPIDFTEGTASQYVMYSGFGQMIGTVDSSGANTSTYHLDPYGALLSITAGGDTKTSQPASGVASKTTTAKPGVKTLSATANAASGGESPFGTFGIEGAVSRYWKRGARWNDTTTGTWTSVDPITVLNDPGRANPYAYAGDNPLNLTDPSGNSFLDFSVSACFGVCISAGVSVGDGGVHPHAGLGLGSEAGVDGSVTAHTGSAESGTSVSGECTGGGGVVGGELSAGGGGGYVGATTGTELGCSSSVNFSG